MKKLLLIYFLAVRPCFAANSLAPNTLPVPTSSSLLSTLPPAPLSPPEHDGDILPTPSPSQSPSKDIVKGTKIYSNYLSTGYLRQHTPTYLQIPASVAEIVNRYLFDPFEIFNLDTEQIKSYIVEKGKYTPGSLIGNVCLLPGGGKKIEVYDMSSGSKVHTFTFKNILTSLDFYDEVALVGTKDGTISLVNTSEWKKANWECKTILKTKSNKNYHLQYDDEKNILFVIYDDGQVIRCDIEKNTQKEYSCQCNKYAITRTFYDRKRKKLGTINSSSFSLWDTQSFNQLMNIDFGTIDCTLHTIPPFSDFKNDCTAMHWYIYTPAHNAILSFHRYCTKLLNIKTKKRKSYQSHNSEQTPESVAQDIEKGRVFVAYLNTIREYDLATGLTKEFQDKEEREISIKWLIFDKKRNILISAGDYCNDSQVAIWNPDTGKVIRRSKSIHGVPKKLTYMSEFNAIIACFNWFDLLYHPGYIPALGIAPHFAVSSGPLMKVLDACTLDEVTNITPQSRDSKMPLGVRYLQEEDIFLALYANAIEGIRGIN